MMLKIRDIRQSSANAKLACSMQSGLARAFTFHIKPGRQSSGLARKRAGPLHINMAQVVYAMRPRPPFSTRVLPKVKSMTDGRSVDVIFGKFS